MWDWWMEEMPIVVSEEKEKENKNIISSTVEKVKIAITRKLLEM